MHKNYIVYQGEAYLLADYDENGYYLYSEDEEKLNEGFEIHPDSTSEGPLYFKYVLEDDIEQGFRITDFALINGRKYSIDRRSDDTYDKADSWIAVVTDDAEALKEDGIWEGVETEVVKYGRKLYHSDKIPIHKVTIMCSREIIPIRISRNFTNKK